MHNGKIYFVFNSKLCSRNATESLPNLLPKFRNKEVLGIEGKIISMSGVGNYLVVGGEINSDYGPSEGIIIIYDLNTKKVIREVYSDENEGITLSVPYFLAATKIANI